jgi:hypothetical protein
MAQALRSAIRMESGDYLADAYKFLWMGGPLYRWSTKEPELIFKEGWTRQDGYDDIVKHTSVAQGKGSNWLSCSLSRTATQDYGTYCYEILLTHPHTKAIDANAMVKAMTKHLNPHFAQQEISVYKKIAASEVRGCWVPIPEAKRDITRDLALTSGHLFFEEEYEYVVNPGYVK